MTFELMLLGMDNGNIVAIKTERLTFAVFWKGVMWIVVVILHLGGLAQSWGRFRENEACLAVQSGPGTLRHVEDRRPGKRRPKQKRRVGQGVCVGTRPELKYTAGNVTRGCSSSKHAATQPLAALSNAWRLRPRMATHGLSPPANRHDT